MTTLHSPGPTALLERADAIEPDVFRIEATEALEAIEAAEQQLLAERFRGLVDRWRAQPSVQSAVEKICMHEAYQEIIGIGPSAIPLILAELQQAPGHWFWALRAITGEVAHSDDERGDLPAMTESWLRWGRDRGYID